MVYINITMILKTIFRTIKKFEQNNLKTILKKNLNKFINKITNKNKEDLKSCAMYRRNIKILNNSICDKSNS